MALRHLIIGAILGLHFDLLASAGDEDLALDDGALPEGGLLALDDEGEYWPAGAGSR